MEGESGRIDRTTVLKNEVKVLYYVQAPSIYQSDPQVKRFQNMDDAECAIAFWRKGLPVGESLGLVDYMVGRDVPRACYELTSVASNVQRISAEEVDYGNDLTRNGGWQMLWPEQKSVAMMEVLVWKFSKLDDLVLDAIAGTLCTAKACILVDKPRKIMGCEKDSNCVERSMTGLLDVYAFQLQNNNSDIKCEEDLMEAAQIYLSSGKAEG